MAATLAGRRTLAGCCAAVLGLGAWLLPGAVAEAATGGYPQANMPCEWSPQRASGPSGTQWCKNFDWGPTPSSIVNGVESVDEPTTISPRGFGYRNCTDYVAFKLGINSSVVRGNAAAWRGQMDEANVTHYPTVGAVAWWGTEVDQGFGHVAVVLAVNDNRSALVGEYNSRLDGTFDTRTIPMRGPGAADAFLHIRDQAVGVAFSPAQPSPAPSPTPSPIATSVLGFPASRPVTAPAGPIVMRDISNPDLARVATGVLAGLAPSVNFHPPTVMRAGVAQLIEVRIAQPSRLVADMNHQLLPAALGSVAPGGPMGATLSGTDVRIEATTPARQPLDAGDAVWQWNVTALHNGPATLNLCFSVDVATAAGPTPSPANCVAQRRIAVTNLPPVLAQGLVGRHIFALVITAAIALLAVAMVARRALRKPDPPAPSAPWSA